MNKIALFFSCIFFCLSQANDSLEMPRLTIEFEEHSLRSALCQLKGVNPYRFIIQDEVPDTLMVANQKFEDKTLFQILDALLADSGFSFVVISDRMIIIYRLSNIIQSQYSMPITVRGKIMDGKFDEPAVGTRVFIKPGDFCLLHRNSHAVLSFAHGLFTHGNIAAIADREGFFEFTVDNPNTYIIVIDVSLDNLPRVVHINDAELIVLEYDVSLLDQWVIVGCGCKTAE